MTTESVLWNPWQGRPTEELRNLLGGLALLLEDADAARKSGNPEAPALRIVAALPGDLLTILRASVEAGFHLEDELGGFEYVLNPGDRALRPQWLTHFRSVVRELGSLGIAAGVVWRGFLGAVEADAKARDRATVALCAGSANRDKDGRVLRLVPDNA